MSNKVLDVFYVCKNIHANYLKNKNNKTDIWQVQKKNFNNSI